MTIKDTFQKWREFRLTESGFNRIKNILQGNVGSVSSVGFITAWNPKPEGGEYAAELPKKENVASNKQLMAGLRSRGYGPIRIRGRFGDLERSFMVPNISRDELIRFAGMFRQESVVWGTKQSDNSYEFEYIEHIKETSPATDDTLARFSGETTNKRTAVLFGDEVDPESPNYSQERQSAGRKFPIPFFDDGYELEEAQVKDFAQGDHLAGLNELCNPSVNGLLSEIREHSRAALYDSVPPKSHWHHLNVGRTKFRELREMVAILSEARHYLKDYAQGNQITLYHYADESLGERFTTDPKFKSQTHSRREMESVTTPRTFFYVDPTQREHLFRAGYSLYRVSVPLDEIYDPLVDPDDLKDQFRDPVDGFSIKGPSGGLQKLYEKIKSYNLGMFVKGRYFDAVVVFQPLELERVSEEERATLEAGR